jgi:hypothetical protein
VALGWEFGTSMACVNIMKYVGSDKHWSVVIPSLKVKLASRIKKMSGRVILKSEKRF